MKSNVMPWTHTGVLEEELHTTCKGQEVVVPAGTECHKLDGGHDPWVVGNLSFIENKHSILYHDADHYGIRVQENALKDIYPVGQSREQMAADLANLPDAAKTKINLAIERGANEVESTPGKQVAFLRGARVNGEITPVVLSSFAEIVYADNALRMTLQRETVNVGEHHGAIESVSGNIVVQSAGRGRIVNHDGRNLDVVPKLGDKAAIKYGKDGKGTVTVSNEQTRTTDLGR